MYVYIVFACSCTCTSQWLCLQVISTGSHPKHQHIIQHHCSLDLQDHIITPIQLPSRDNPLIHLNYSITLYNNGEMRAAGKFSRTRLRLTDLPTLALRYMINERYCQEIVYTLCSFKKIVPASQAYIAHNSIKLATVYRNIRDYMLWACTKWQLLQVENHFFKMKGWLEAQKRKKQWVITQQRCTKLHDTIPISLFDIIKLCLWTIITKI